MFNSSSLDTTPRRNYKRHANRKRNGYELTSQRSMLPIALGAGVASIMVYCLLYYYAPAILEFRMRVINDPPEEVPVEYTRIVVKPRPDDQKIEAEDIVETEEPVEIEDIPHEPVEIDILDVDVPELIMAPGSTDLTVPEPISTQETAPDISELKPTDTGLDLTAIPSPPPEVVAIPEPTPINQNDIVAHATAQQDLLADADGTRESDLTQTAQASADGNQGDDGRSLTDLLGEKNLGAASGVARLNTDVLFGFNECKLKNTARISLQQLASLIWKNPETIFIIEGHTDSIGGASYNALLSMQRAAAVREWLRSMHIPTDKVYIRACADNSPLASTKGDRDAQAMNRRVEIHMRKPTENMPPGCENDKYKVDLTTKLSAQLAAGVVIPHTYPSASAKTPAAAKPASPAKPARRGNNGRRRR